MKEIHDSKPNFIERMIHTESIIKNLHSDKVLLWKINPKDTPSIYEFLKRTKNEMNTVFTKDLFLGAGLDLTTSKSHAIGNHGFYNILEQI